MKALHATPFLLLCAGLLPLAASAGESVTQCVSLGNSQEIVRSAGGQQFFLKDGDSHYRVGFAHSCDSIMTTPSVEISTNGEVNQLCPEGTKVKTKRDSCRVEAVETISAEEFDRRKKRASR